MDSGVVSGGGPTGNYHFSLFASNQERELSREYTKTGRVKHGAPFSILIFTFHTTQKSGT
jgi:hypothetical protein